MGPIVWDAVNRVFDAMPVAAVVDHQVFFETSRIYF